VPPGEGRRGRGAGTVPTVYVRQCTRCGVIAAPETFPDEDAAAAPAPGWVCEHCGGTAFEAVVMMDTEPLDPLDLDE
jgi:hypothetical protein